MPMISDKNEFIVLTFQEWQNLPEFNLRSSTLLDDGSRVREKRVIVKNIRCLIEDDRDVLFPYITYYDKEEEKTERLVKVDNLFKLRNVSDDESKPILETKAWLDIVTKVNTGLEIRDLIVFDTINIYNWIKRVKERYVNLPHEYFPRAFKIQHKKNYTHHMSPNLNRESYLIIPLELEPSYLGECKYRG